MTIIMQQGSDRGSAEDVQQVNTEREMHGFAGTSDVSSHTAVSLYELSHTLQYVRELFVA